MKATRRILSFRNPNDVACSLGAICPSVLSLIPISASTPENTNSTDNREQWQKSTKKLLEKTRWTQTRDGHFHSYTKIRTVGCLLPLRLGQWMCLFIMMSKPGTNTKILQSKNLFCGWVKLAVSLEIEERIGLD